MVKRKVAELEGAALDWAVAKAVYPCSVPAADGGRLRVINDDEELVGSVWANGSEGWTTTWSPSTDWSQCGQLIERYELTLSRFDDGLIEAYRNDEAAPQASRSYLVAACRAIVASELGEEVEIPEELANAGFE